VFEIIFYKDIKGNKPVLDYLNRLNKRNNKDNRINVNKIYDYLDVLRQVGTAAGEPYIKHLDGAIWELRPIKNRILFAAWNGKSFILLHHFTKKTRKTPPSEIEQAKRHLADWEERSKNDE
jgi:phage-related protein